jgi:cytochrome P450
VEPSSEPDGLNPWLADSHAGHSQTGPSVAEMTRISDPEEVEEVLRCVDIAADLHNRDSAPLLGGTILTLTGQEHLQRRRAEARVFVRSSLRHFEETVLVPAIERRLDHLARHSRGADGVVRADLLSLTRLVLVQLTAAMMGLDGTDDDESIEALYDCAERFGEAASVEWSLGDHQAILRSALEAASTFDRRWLAPSLARRRDLLGSGADAPTDLLTMLLAHAPDLDDAALRREAIFFLLASSSTTTHATPHVLHEILQWVEVHPEDRRRLTDAEFVRSAVNEALRLHPPVPALLRRALRRVQLSSGRVIEAGEHIAVDVETVNDHAEVFGIGPLTFDPHRPYAGSGHPYGYAFGSGPHMCLGRPLATSTNRSEDPGAPLGVIVRLAMALFEAGLRMDPDGPAPALRADTAAHRFESFQVLLTAI